MFIRASAARNKTRKGYEGRPLASVLAAGEGHTKRAGDEHADVLCHLLADQS